MSASSEGPSDPQAAGYHGVLKTIGRAGADLYVCFAIGWSLSKPQQPLKVGDTAPDFFLPDESARLVSLASLLRKGPSSIFCAVAGITSISAVCGRLT
jgi:hypothetical protein